MRDVRQPSKQTLRKGRSPGPVRHLRLPEPALGVHGLVERSAHAAAGELLGGRYRLVSRVGEGGMAEVWCAVDRVTRQSVAIKFPRFEGADSAEHEARLLHEVVTTGASRHPNVVSVIDHGRTADGRLYVAFELLDGEDLEQVLAREGRLPVAAACWIAAQVAAGLAAAHERGIVHCDVKPANVFLQRHPGGAEPEPGAPLRVGRVRVLDFGLAASGTGDGSSGGALAYQSPERLAGALPTAAADLYALGCVLWRLLTGRAPFTGTVAEVLAAHAAPERPELPPRLGGRPTPPALQRILNALVAVDPAARPSSAQAVVTALAPFAPGPTAVLRVSRDLLIAPVQADALPADQELRLDSPLVGRDDEQALLRTLAQDFASQRRPRAVCLHGTEGSGRNQLTRWLASQAEALAGARVMHRSCLRPPGPAMPAVRDLVEDLLGLHGADPSRCEATVWASVDAADEAARYEAAELLRFLRPRQDFRSLFDIDVQASRAALFSAVRAPFLRAARSRPLVLVLSDVHAADPMTLDWLADCVLALADAQAPLLFVTGWRDTAHAPELANLAARLDLAASLAPETVQVVGLGPVSTDAVQAWLQDVGRLDPELRTYLAELAAGNRHVAEAALRGHLADGKVQFRDGCWRAVMPLQVDRQLSDRLRAAFDAELAAFLRRHAGSGPIERLLLHALAVLGGQQPVELVRATVARLHADCADAHTFGEAVHRAEAAGLLRLVRVGERDEVVLRHPGLGDAVLASCRDGARPMHGAAAAVLRETSHPPAAYVPHLWRSGQLQEAWQATRLGVAASAMLLDGHAVDQLLAEAERFAGWEDAVAGTHDVTTPLPLPLPDLVWVLQRRADALSQLARYSDAIYRYEEICLLVPAGYGADPRTSRARAEAQLGLAAVAEAQGRLGEALGHLAQALEAAGDDISLAGRVRSVRGKVLHWQGRLAEAAAEYAEAEQALLAAGDLTATLRCRVEHASMCHARQDLAMARQLLASVAAAIDGVADPLLRARYLYIEGCVRVAAHQTRDALPVYRQALELLRALGHRRGVAGTLANLATAHGHLRQPAEAEPLHLEALRLREALQDARGIVQSCNNLADFYLEFDRPLDAEPLARRAVREANRMGARQPEVIALATLAQALTRNGRTDEAEGAALEALHLNGEPPLRPGVVSDCWRVLAECASRRGDFEHAWQCLRRADQARKEPS